MTCAQGLLRLLWGGPKVGVLRDWLDKETVVSFFEASSLHTAFTIAKAAGLINVSPIG